MTVRSDAVTGQFSFLLVAPRGASSQDCSPTSGGSSDSQAVRVRCRATVRVLITRLLICRIPWETLFRRLGDTT